jgi:2-iminobutanoate/2-iminopropanoate deaminase
MIRAWTFGPEHGVPPPVAPFAHATAAGQTLYVTGQMPTDLEGRLVTGGIVAQTERVLANLARVLELAGGGMQDAVAARAFLCDWEDYAAFNEAYERWFPARLPSRTCVGVSGLAVGALVEIDLTAWREQGWPGAVDAMSATSAGSGGRLR